ncbi:hypothetical protein JCM14076_14990 [Methylosoma difficile]
MATLYTRAIDANNLLYPGQIVSTAFAYASVLTGGAVYAWGDANYGGSISAVSTSLNGTTDVTRIYANAFAFAALRTDGSVITWGDANNGGNSSAVAGELNGSTSSKDVQKIYATSSAFAALRADGSVIAWGNADFGGDTSAVNATLNQNAAIDIVEIYHTEKAFAARRTDGSVVAWGNAAYGGSTSGITKLNGSGAVDVVEVVAGRSAFAARLTDGSVVTWGDSVHGGDSSAVADKLSGSGTLQNVTKVVTNGLAFAALRADGSVVTWGDSNYGGNSSAVAGDINGTVDVTQLFAIGSSFAALRADGKMFSWGGGGSIADTYVGGIGSDVYLVDNSGDLIVEASTVATEIDTVFSSVSFALTANLENLTLIGTSAIDATGNSLNNTLVGNDKNNSLQGAAGADVMIGGLGNDSYFVDNSGDVVIETSTFATEVDLVSSAISYVLGANIENLTLLGTATNNGTGNSLNNVLVGNSGTNNLLGGAGDDMLTGGNGTDIYNPGSGKDTLNLAETTAATDTVKIATGNSLVGSFDVINGFQKGLSVSSSAGVDKLDLQSTTVAANTVGTNGSDAGVIKSHAISNGLITFDDVDTYASALGIGAGNLTNVLAYLQTNITSTGATVVFNVGADAYVFQNDGNNDLLVGIGWG